MTPLLTTSSLSLLARAMRTGHGPSLALAGLLAGIALQSHPTVVALLPGALVWALRRRRRLLAPAWLGAAIAFGAVGCADLLVYNLLTSFDSVRAALAKSGAYAAERPESVGFATALGLELAGLARVLAGAVGEARGDLVPLLRPDVVLWAFVAPSAICFAARRGIDLPAFVAPPFLLILPLFNGKYEPLLNGRYLMPLVPLIGVAAAFCAVAAWVQWSRPTTWPKLAAGGAVATVLLASPLLSLTRYERAALAEGGNLPYVELAERVRRERRPSEAVLLDADLGGTRLASGRQGVSVVEYLLVVHRDPPPARSGDAGELQAMLGASPNDKLLVLLPDARQRLAARYQLAAVGPSPSGREQRLRNVGLYRAASRR